jgi:protein-tyrosine phosphatase
MLKILFVCLGNICRSPMAEAVFAHKIREIGLDSQVQVDSAGTGDWHIGANPHSGTLNILAKNTIDYSHQARVLRKSDYDEFDLILAMDDDNFQVISSRGHGKAQVHKLLEFAPDCGLDDVPDPYYSGNFAQTYELVNNASDGLLTWVKGKLNI